jgi:hypothetical protein
MELCLSSANSFYSVHEHESKMRENGIKEMKMKG